MASKLLNTGLAVLTNLLSGIGGTVPKYLGWGTGTNAPAVTDTGLQTPSAEARTSGTVTRTTITATNDTMQVVGSITSLSIQTISEVCLFDASTSGNAWSRTTFTGLPFNIGDSVNFTATTQFAST